MEHTIISAIRKNQASFHPVMNFDPAEDTLVAMDFTANNNSLSHEIINDIDLFCKYVEAQRSSSGARYGVGGYNELRTVYDRSELFGVKGTEEPRRLHLGIDIWGEEGEPVYAFMGGMVHSFAFNDNYGDYGATLILMHQLESIPFYTLYGHISLKDISNIHEGQYLNRGEVIAHVGAPHENGHWPPHLHFQIINELGVKMGDYPGVCRFSEKDKYLANCPDPNEILQWDRFLK